MQNFERVLANEAKREDSRDRPGSAFLHAKGGNVKWPDVDEQLRGALRRMTYAAEGMSRLPTGCTFTVAVELRDEGVAPIGVSTFLTTVCFHVFKMPRFFLSS